MTELKTGKRRGSRAIALLFLVGAALFGLLGELADSHGALIVCGGMFTLALVEWQGRT